MWTKRRLTTISISCGGGSDASETVRLCDSELSTCLYPLDLPRDSFYALPLICFHLLPTAATPSLPRASSPAAARRTSFERVIGPPAAYFRRTSYLITLKKIFPGAATKPLSDRDNKGTISDNKNF